MEIDDARAADVAKTTIFGCFSVTTPMIDASAPLGCRRIRSSTISTALSPTIATSLRSFAT
jgi:hypothetical protein